MAEIRRSWILSLRPKENTNKYSSISVNPYQCAMNNAATRWSINVFAVSGILNIFFSWRSKRGGGILTCRVDAKSSILSRNTFNRPVNNLLSAD